MPFFHFSQNNSGGTFAFDAQAGITHHVIIEAETAEKANYKAFEIGLYFDGCADGIDCSCCGDRWCEVSDYDKADTPKVYDHKLGVFYAEGLGLRSGGWMAPEPEAVVHFADGARKWYDNNAMEVPAP